MNNEISKNMCVKGLFFVLPFLIINNLNKQITKINSFAKINIPIYILTIIWTLCIYYVIPIFNIYRILIFCFLILSFPIIALFLNYNLLLIVITNIFLFLLQLSIFISENLYGCISTIQEYQENKSCDDCDCPISLTETSFPESMSSISFFFGIWISILVLLDYIHVLFSLISCFLIKNKKIHSKGQEDSQIIYNPTPEFKITTLYPNIEKEKETYV